MTLDLTLPWPLGLSPNRARRVPMASRTGHESEDRQRAYEITCNAPKPAIALPDEIMPLVLTANPPYRRHLDALSFHYMLKAQLDGVADALAIDDWQFWPVVVKIGLPASGGQVGVQIGLGHVCPLCQAPARYRIDSALSTAPVVSVGG